MKQVNVVIWSDFVCPWCWIAKRRFEKALAGLADQVEVVVTTKSYRLARGIEPMDYKAALYQKLGGPAAADRMMAAVSDNGAMENLAYNFTTMRFGDTSAAHTAIKSIRSPVLAQDMTERVYKAVTTDGLDIFDREVLVSLAKEVGLTDTRFDFDSPKIRSEIERNEREANQITNGVPLFLFNNKLYLSGAQKVAVFEKALLEAATDVPTVLNASEGESCGIDGCQR
ncbi:disulfide bond formation protein DsbA [Pollutimonas subterranea]|uniref:Disulfide bond formation protein DsbA n=1 Tax=Pollutimonas subterranea TaxID=2045210 RepID=A0A2N4U6W7_9BURK|nr:DsbA family oxidoreductase [Pollutimonas subterranea]PLC50737.1 disulfide bond formation protein DsbA [Pollutimonas subterranea]